MSLAEKFQITVPAKIEGDEPWVSAESTRCNVGVTEPGSGNRFNKMPPGYDATNERDHFVRGFGGDTDVTGDVLPQSLVDGFHKKPMKGTDDQYTGEHCDLFYGDAGGFVERNNYLDRE